MLFSKIIKYLWYTKRKIKLNTKKMEAKFKSITTGGFQMTFENGNTISVMFGLGNYCGNRGRKQKDIENNCDVSCNNAEVAIWNKDGEDYKFNGNQRTCEGWLSSDEVAKWIDFAAKNTF